MIVGSKFASKSHKGTTEYYIATSGTNDWLNYQKIEDVAPIGTVSDVKILANGSVTGLISTFDSNANNEQCNTLVNAGVCAYCYIMQISTHKILIIVKESGIRSTCVWWYYTR